MSRVGFFMQGVNKNDEEVLGPVIRMSSRRNPFVFLFDGDKVGIGAGEPMLIKGLIGRTCSIKRIDCNGLIKGKRLTKGNGKGTVPTKGTPNSPQRENRAAK